VTASATVMQLVRAHFERDDAAFANAAMTLARAASAGTVRQSIIDTVRKGYQRRPGADLAKQRDASRAPVVASSGLLQALPTVRFDDLVLEPQLQAALDECVLELEYREELAERGIRARNRFLLWGPPGNGKSSVSAAVASALGVQAYGVSLPRIISENMGGTGKHLGELFDSLRPDTLVVFDEIDALGARRESGGSSAGKEMNNIVNTMLTLMDRTKHGVMVATTNRLDMLDEALVRRFDEVLEAPAPTVQQMRALAEKLCTGFGVRPIDVSSCRNFDEVAKLCETTARRIIMREILDAEDRDDAADPEAEQIN
jgi:SpoVK/Ycf46/Vps4 family AAA+-type ATPase